MTPESNIGDLGYGYDSIGRFTAQTGSYASQTLPAASSGANAFDDNNRQTQYNGQTLSYDANGNLTGDGTRTYVWNSRNQLTQIQQGGNTLASYQYDALGRRISKTEAGTTTGYLYDGADAVQETQGATINPLLTGLGIDQRYARNDSGGRTYFLTDHLGSTRALTDATGNVVNRYDYTAYGQTSQTGSGFSNPYQYTGRERDVTGLYYYRARYYQPDMGRFINEDSYGFAAGDNNFYAYALGNPISYNDPSGHLVWFAAIPIIWGGIEIALSVYDAYDTGKTLLDPCASSGRKAVSAGLFVAGLVLPGTYGWADDASDRIKPFALGLGDYLDDFARARGAETWKDLPDPTQWKSGVLDALANPSRQVHFNLDGVDVWGGLQRGSSGRGGATDWELIQVQQTPQFWNSLEFWKNGEKVENPFKR